MTQLHDLRLRLLVQAGKRSASPVASRGRTGPFLWCRQLALCWLALLSRSPEGSGSEARASMANGAGLGGLPMRCVCRDVLQVRSSGQPAQEETLPPPLGKKERVSRFCPGLADPLKAARNAHDGTQKEIGSVVPEEPCNVRIVRRLSGNK